MTAYRKLALALLSASALSLTATDAIAQAAGTCIVVGKEVPAAKDTACPGDVLATLRSYSYEYKVEKLDANGNRVFDHKTQRPVMETRRETFGLMATLLEAAGLTEAMANGTVTVFAVPDTVLRELAPDWQAALQDKDRQAEAVAAIASHVVDEPMRRAWFASSNGKVWTLAGGWASGAKPVDFHDLTAGAPLRINGAAVGNADVEASNGIIHVVAQPLAGMKMPVTVAKAH